MSKIKKLKPCPFCGSEATIRKTMDEDLWSTKLFLITKLDVINVKFGQNIHVMVMSLLLKKRGINVLRKRL